MKILKTVGELFAPNDPELVEKTLARLAEQDTWNDVFSTKLIELLDNIDAVKGEIRERMRKVESVTQAESLLLEEAAKTEALNHKLADTEKNLDAARREFLEAKGQYTGAEMLRTDSENLVSQAESRYSSARSLLEDANTGYQSAMELASSSGDAYRESSEKLQESSRAYKDATGKSAEARGSLDAASRRLDGAESAYHLAFQSEVEAKHLLERATSQLNEVLSLTNEAKRQFEAAQGRLASAISTLTAAFKRAECAEQKQLEAARLFRLTVRCATVAVALSWIATVWMGWFALRAVVPIWAACVLSVLMLIVTILVTRGVKDEA